MSRFLELRKLYKLARKAKRYGRVEIVEEVSTRKGSFPIHSFAFGSEDKSLPTLGIFAGVHGLERIGTHLATFYLRCFLARLGWDQSLHRLLEETRIVFMPLVNPGGMRLRMRSNPRGIDLMRNSPTQSEDKVAFLVGGHRISPKLAWYRGAEGEPMEIESQAVVDFCKKELFPSRFSIALDIHSGFGMKDRLWYPYAKTKGHYPSEKESLAMGRLLKRTQPYHVYAIEPQSKSYTTHGDLWDYLYDEHRDQFSGEKHFLPWTLEMGSWMWVRKNPRQIFSLLGGFNPIVPHRYKRIMRRHTFLLNFLHEAVYSHEKWIEK